MPRFTNQRSTRTSSRATRTSSRTKSRRARGAVTLELILTLPIWLILLLGLVEFGLILTNQQQVALAARVGAEEASQTTLLSTIDGDPVPPNVLGAVAQQLAGSRMSPCKVILEHNVVPDSPPIISLPVTLSSSTGACDCDAPAIPLPPRRRYTRVTVFVPLTEVTPNLLRLFGFDISEELLHHTATFRYEL